MKGWMARLEKVFVSLVHRCYPSYLIFTSLCSLSVSVCPPSAPKPGENGKAGNLYWPPASALTARLRRLITAYQRTHKREQLRQEAMTKPDRRRRRPRDDILAMVTEGGAYAPEGAVAFMAEGGPFMAKGSPYIPDSAALLADGAAYFKERRQR